jgi:hypothetical protein
MKGPIFIGGMMKSGTSLLRVLISNHPNIYGGLETHWFNSDILINFKDHNSPRIKLLRELYDVDESDFINLQQCSTSGIDFFNNFMIYCAERANKKRWVEKTPDNIFHLPLIKKTWPSAKFIHVIRDHRDIYASWKKNNKLDLAQFIINVKRIKEIIPDYKELNNKFYMEINYLDIILDTTNSLKKIFEHMDEPWVEGLDNYGGDSFAYDKILETTNKVSPTALSLRKPIFQTSIGRWKNILSAEEIQAIEKEM